MIFLLQLQPLLTYPHSPRKNSITCSIGKYMQGNLLSNMAVIDNIKIFQSEPWCSAIGSIFVLSLSFFSFLSLSLSLSLSLFFFFFGNKVTTSLFNGMRVEEMAFPLSGIPIFFAFLKGTWALNLLNYGILFDDMIIEIAKDCAFVNHCWDLSQVPF